MPKLRYDRTRVAEARDVRARWNVGEKTERTPFVFTVPPGVRSYALTGCPYTYKELCGTISPPAQADRRVLHG